MGRCGLRDRRAFGLATPGGLISQTGVAGLTLSGGFGWLRGTHGLCVDNLEAVDIVTADGRMLHADAENTPTCSGPCVAAAAISVWSLASPSACIRSRLRLCSAVPSYPEVRASELIALWRDFMARAPAALSSLVEFSTVPDDPAYPDAARGQRVISLAAVYDGPADEGEALVAPLRAYGTPAGGFQRRHALPRRSRATYDAIFPKGRDRCYWKSLYLRTLDDEVIGDIVGHLARRPSEMTFASIWAFGCAVRRVPAAATAFGDRSAPYMLSLDAIWSERGR